MAGADIAMLRREVATPGGLEPPTPRLGISCSILLSYGAAFSPYTALNSSTVGLNSLSDFLGPAQKSHYVTHREEFGAMVRSNAARWSGLHWRRLYCFQGNARRY